LSLQKAKAQHSVLSTNLHRQGYREAKLHVIFVEVMKTIYKDSTDQPLAGLNLDHHKIENQTHKLNKHSIKHASTLIKTRYALQYNLNNNSQGVGLGAMIHNVLRPVICVKSRYLRTCSGKLKSILVNFGLRRM
jgi:hypothetical protein